MFAEEFGPQAFIVRARREGLRDFGACMSPTTAFHVLQGLETLPIRMEKHVANTRQVVAFLDEHEAVESVSYPELPSHPDHDLSARLSAQGRGRRVQLRHQGRPGCGTNVHREPVDLLASGQCRRRQVPWSSIPPARPITAWTPKRWPPPASARVWFDLSIGLEDPRDLIGDLSRALRRAARTPR